MEWPTWGPEFGPHRQSHVSQEMTNFIPATKTITATASKEYRQLQQQQHRQWQQQPQHQQQQQHHKQYKRNNINSGYSKNNTTNKATQIITEATKATTTTEKEKKVFWSSHFWHFFQNFVAEGKNRTRPIQKIKNLRRLLSPTFLLMLEPFTE